MACLTVHDGGRGEDVVTGRQVLEEIHEVICRSLLRMALDDPVRPHLMAFIPLFGRDLGYPPVRGDA